MIVEVWHQSSCGMGLGDAVRAIWGRCCRNFRRYQEAGIKLWFRTQLSWAILCSQFRVAPRVNPSSLFLWDEGFLCFHL